MSNNDNKEILNQIKFWQNFSSILGSYGTASEELTKEQFNELQKDIDGLEQLNGRLKQKHHAFITQLRDLTVIKLNAWPNIIYGVFVDEETDKLYNVADNQLKKYFRQRQKQPQ